VRSTLRRRWRSAAAIAFMVAIASAAVLTLAAGARRTTSAPDAFTRSVGGDATAQVMQPDGPPRTAEVAKLPGVQSVSGLTFTFVAVDPGGSENGNTLAFIGAHPFASKLVAGRFADPTQPYEFVADKKFTALHHAHVGQKFAAVSWTAKQVQAGQGFVADPDGPSFRATLVGIVSSPSSLEDIYNTTVFSPALLTHGLVYGETIMGVYTRPGVTTNDLRAQLDRLHDGSSLSLGPGAVIGSDVRSAVDAQAEGTWLLAGVAALASVIALGQILTRHVRLSDDERNSLSTVGFTRGQLIAASTAQAAVPAVSGLVVGIVIAVAASGIFPAGFVRSVEPHPGVRVDATLLGVGSLGLLVAFLAWVAVALLTFGPRYSRRSRSAAHDVITRRSPSATAAVGARFALTIRGRSSAGTIVTLAVIVAGIVGTVGFAVSLDRLVTEPARFGENYAFSFGDNSELTAGQLKQALTNDPDIASVMIVTGDQGRSGKTSVDLVGFEQAEGDLTPHLLSGRLPTAPDQLALGRVTARALHLGTGDTMELAGADGQATFHVVGMAVVPTIAGDDGVGKGALLTAAGFARLVKQPSSNLAGIRLRPGAPADTRARLSKKLSLDAGLEDPPGAIVNLGRIRRIPVFLAVLLGVLLLMATFNAIIVSVQLRRQDLAVLSAMGADRRWIGRAVHWQTTILAVLPLVIGIPLGLIAGSAVFRAFVDRIGAVPDPSVPIVLVLGLAVALVVAANVVALLPTRRARRLSTAELLRAD
jgi:ABC-type lipoprotein release transport system permease subunit